MKKLIILILSITLISGFTYKVVRNPQKNNQLMTQTTEIATFGNGCFWCTEAVFESLKGVQKVVSGYSGGKTVNPTYKEVCTGATGHAEVVQITYDPTVITFETLVKVFFDTHDPTTLNRQGNDVGTQYRSVIFYHNENQKIIALHAMRTLSTNKIYQHPIVTEITPFTVFYPAENYHQEYYQHHGHEPYCSLVIQPKLAKFKLKYKDYLK